MIFSSIYANEDMSRYPEAIQKALVYLKEHDFTIMEPGRYEIQGNEIYAQLMDAKTAEASEKRPEAHVKYLDVQFLVSGKERLGYAPNTGKSEIDEQFDDRDVIFYKTVEHENFVDSVPGCFCVFFPEDIHRPNVASGEPMTVRKVVIKVSMSLL